MGEARALAVAVAVAAYRELVAARKAYMRAMLIAYGSGVTFGELARELGLSEPAVRGFIRRAQKRGEK